MSETTTDSITTALSGHELLADPQLNKGAAFSEAERDAFAQRATATLTAPERRHLHSALEKIIEDYLSVDHRDDRSGGCPLTSLGSELARADTQTRENASAGFQKLVETIAGEFRTISPEAAKARAVFALSAMVGAVTISRIVTDPELSDFILEQTKKQLMRA